MRDIPAPLKRQDCRVRQACPATQGGGSSREQAGFEACLCFISWIETKSVTPVETSSTVPGCNRQRKARASGRMVGREGLDFLLDFLISLFTFCVVLSLYHDCRILYIRVTSQRLDTERKQLVYLSARCSLCVGLLQKSKLDPRGPDGQYFGLGVPSSLELYNSVMVAQKQMWTIHRTAMDGCVPGKPYL